MYHVINNVLIGLNRVGGVFYDYSASVFIQLALLVILLFIIDLLLRKRVRAIFRYCVWLLVLVKLILPPMLSLPTGIGYWAGDHIPDVSGFSNRAFDADALEFTGPSGEMRHVRPAENLAGDDPVATPVDAVLTPLTWKAVVFLLWIAGVLAFLAVLVQRIRFVKGLVAASSPAGDELTGLLEQCRRQMAVRRKIKLRLSEAIPSPAVCGLLRPTVLMPTSLVGKLSPEGLRATLIHELAHIKRGDLWVNSVQTFLQVVYFYNPFVWFANSIIRKVCEEAVDETVLVALGGEAKHYSNTLIDIGEMVFWKADLGLRLIGVAESKKALQWRIKHMLNRPIPKSSKLGALGIIMLLVIAAVLLPMAKAEKSNEDNKPVLTENERKSTESLHQAAKDGDLEQVKSLIAKGTDINTKDKKGQTPLHFAARHGHREIAILLITQGADVNASMANQSWTPLLDAANAGHAQVIKVLLENGAKVDVGDVYGHTPLVYALWAKDEESVKTIISAGADINKCPNESDCTPLFYAVWDGYQTGTRILIDAGADVNAEDEGGWTPLYHAINGANADVARQFIGTGVKIPALHNAILEGNLARVKQFIESGTDVDTRDKFGCTPAYWALSVGRKEIAEYLLDQGADVKAKTRQGRTLLHQASTAGFVEIVKSLIAKGVDVDAKSDRGNTPLKIAAGAGHKEIVKLLIANGAAVNITAKNGMHPLGDAAVGGHEEVVRLLLASGAEVNLQPEDKLMCGTALHAAARGGHIAILDLLIANGADVNAIYKNGTPLHLAVAHLPDVEDKRSEEIVEKLLAHGADVNAKSPSRGHTPLHQAAERGHYTLAERLIAAGADVSATDKEGHTPLWYAKDKDCTEIVELLRKHGAKDESSVDSRESEATKPVIAENEEEPARSLHQTVMYGDVEQVKALIADGAHVNAKDKLGATPLHRAAEKGSAVIVELLIAKGADVNAKCRLDRTPLHQAASKGHKDVVQILLDSDAKINAKSVMGLTPLHTAILCSHTEVARMLIRRGADVNTRAEGDIATPMDSAVFKGLHDMVELLIDSGADIPFPDIHFAAFQGDVSKVKDLIQRGANVDEEDRRGKTPLFFAVWGGQGETVEFLLSNAADVDANNVDGRTPLHYTASSSNLKMTGLLLAKGADIDVRDKWGGTPLHGAAKDGRKETASLLIKKGADVNAKNKEGRTPLHEAIEYYGKEVKALLIAAGADVNAEDEDGYTPLYLATIERDEDIIDLLKSKGATLTATIHLAAVTGDFAGVKRYIEEGADINKGDKSGWTPLLLAVFCGQEGGQEEVVEFLLANGADVNASRNDGWTPLHMACQIGRKDMVELLIAKGADVNAKSDGGRTPTDCAKRFKYLEIIDLLRKNGAKE